jgi:hypothetical protein
MKDTPVRSRDLNAGRLVELSIDEAGVLDRVNVRVGARH